VSSTHGSVTSPRYCEFFRIIPNAATEESTRMDVPLPGRRAEVLQGNTDGFRCGKRTAIQLSGDRLAAMHPRCLRPFGSNSIEARVRD
jgi:hypothetical protein